MTAFPVEENEQTFPSMIAESIERLEPALDILKNTDQVETAFVMSVFIHDVMDHVEKAMQLCMYAIAQDGDRDKIQAATIAASENLHTILSMNERMKDA